mmetsp:Transcript_9604/g.14134  ORF Transcript_9604/g.14134 Transcript_9604/m.14134 type:complete len:121 (-) Transcript_9604:511-873(-)
MACVEIYISRSKRDGEEIKIGISLSLFLFSLLWFRKIHHSFFKCVLHLFSTIYAIIQPSISIHIRTQKHHEINSPNDTNSSMMIKVHTPKSHTMTHYFISFQCHVIRYTYTLTWKQRIGL